MCRYGSGLQQTFEYEFSSTWLKHEVLNSDGMCPLAIVLSSTQLPPIYQVTAVNITASSTRKRPLSADVAGQYLVTEHQALELKVVACNHACTPADCLSGNLWA